MPVDEKNIQIQVNELLDRPLDDPSEVLEVVVGAILKKKIPPATIRNAVRTAVTDYESQLRVFMVGVAKRQLQRILNLMNSLDYLEDQLVSPAIISGMTARDILRLYALQQENLIMSLDYVKKVADMRIELANVSIPGALSDEDTTEIDAMSHLPKLSAQQRGHVRTIIAGLVSGIKNEDDE